MFTCLSDTLSVFRKEGLIIAGGIEVALIPLILECTQISLQYYMLQLTVRVRVNFGR